MAKKLALSVCCGKFSPYKPAHAAKKSSAFAVSQGANCVLLAGLAVPSLAVPAPLVLVFDAVPLVLVFGAVP